MGGGGPIIPAGAWTRIRFDNVTFDTLNEFDLVNFTYTPRHAGYYHVDAAISLTGAPGAHTEQMAVDIVAGAVLIEVDQLYPVLSLSHLGASTIFYLTPNNVVEMIVQHTLAGGMNPINADIGYTYLSIHRVA